MAWKGTPMRPGRTHQGPQSQPARPRGWTPAPVLQRMTPTRTWLLPGELIVTGPTGTNVNDVTFILVDGEG